MLGTPAWIWVGFLILLVALLALDFRVFHRKAHRVGTREALIESAAWIGAALVFNLALYFWRGPQAGVEFLTGYLIEKSLSVDNIFVILVIFQAFRIPAEFQHRVLYYGVVGALVMRGVFVVAGVRLLEAFHPFLYIFGAILLLTGIRMILPCAKSLQPEKNWIARLAEKIFPTSDQLDGQKFWVNRDGRWLATPLFLALVTVEAMDILFAIDSVPAVLAITQDAFIVFSSNAFAILGLRALFFALADLLPRFRFLHQGLALLLIFVGLKMTLHDRLNLPDLASLVVVAAILGLTIAASLLWPGKKADANSLHA
ncbi:MAG TPA: TerC family protein [Candidatus Acidoferrum sp.]|nr:TerC family protein [Candidatus Acidoferrum sp.]